MSKFPPNSLVTALGIELVSVVMVPDESGTMTRVSPSQAPPDVVAKALADSSVPELVTFAGFLGAAFTDTAGRTWQFLYLDPKLLTWMVVNEDDIVLHRELQDVTMLTAGRSAIVRDLIWLRSSASVTEGSGPPRTHEIEAQFLRGDFIGAGDFSAALTGGTFSRATGLLCEVQTPGCCGRRTQ